MTNQKLIRMIEANGLTLHGDIEHFAALVAAAEREACIDLVAMYGGPVDLEAAIRARGEK